jgi:serine/threonine-protein kinase
MSETDSSETNPSLAENQKAERQVGSYVLEQKLGEGGMAEVWKARHQVLGTYVAIKFLSAGYAGTPDVEQRFLNEGKKQARLFHPNIVSAYDFIYADGRSYLIMKFIEGESLDELLFRLQAPMQLPQVLAISTDVLHALEYAHTQNIVHRDIKPSNILIEKGERALVTDFGVAMVVGEKRVTRVGMAIGTPHYMSPEQILGSADIDRRADIYSFGCVLYQMLTGKAPFEAVEGEDDTEFIIQDKHVRQQPVPPRQWNPYIPEHIERAVLKCLEKKAADRFVSCQDLLAALTNPPVEEPKPRSVTVIEMAAPERPKTVVEQSRPRRETLIETGPARTDTVIETVNDTVLPKLATDVAQLPQQPTEPITPAPAKPARDLTIVWLLGTALLSASLVGGVYLYLHRPKPEPVKIIDNNPPPTPGPEPPIAKPPAGQGNTPVDGSGSVDQSPQPPVNPPVTKPDEPPVQHTPDEPVDSRPPSQPPVETPSPDSGTTKPAPADNGPSNTPEVYTPAPAKPPAPQRRYASEGNLIWSGQIDKNQVIQISGNATNIGNVAGDIFPGAGVPIQVSVNSDKFAVISQPNPLNQFSQMSLRSTMKGNIAITIHWKVLPSE